jgi:hypothetical protein
MKDGAEPVHPCLPRFKPLFQGFAQHQTIGPIRFVLLRRNAFPDLLIKQIQRLENSNPWKLID